MTTLLEEAKKISAPVHKHRVLTRGGLMEVTQAIIAMALVATAAVVWLRAPEGTKDLSAAVFMVIGFYFGRTSQKE